MDVLRIPHVKYNLIHARIVIDGKEQDSVRMVPLFERGVSLVFSTYGDEKLLKEIDVMRDFPINNYIPEVRKIVE